MLYEAPTLAKPKGPPIGAPIPPPTLTLQPIESPSVCVYVLDSPLVIDFCKDTVLFAILEQISFIFIISLTLSSISSF